jgi:flagellar basal-body rod protein FlgF
MDNSVYITLSRQLALFRDMAVTANNIANANTTGYASENMLFNSYLTKDVNQKNRNDMAFAYDISTYKNFDNGPIHATGNPLDLAIASEGFFAVETPLGVRYTRAGNFQLDGSGTLVTAEGNPVLGNNGQHITFTPEAQDIKIGEAGNISVDGAEFATIDVYKFENPQLLERTEGAMFKSEITPEILVNAKVMQGALSGSNVKSVLSLTHMIDVSRSVSSTAKMIETLYDLQRKSANTWAQQAS